MPRKKKTRPKFKVGDWVHLSEDGLYKAHLWPKLSHGPWRIKHMNYYKDYEDIPSPWGIVLEGYEEYKDEADCLFKEDVRKDVFMTAVSDAVKNQGETECLKRNLNRSVAG